MITWAEYPRGALQVGSNRAALARPGRDGHVEREHEQRYRNTMVGMEVGEVEGPGKELLGDDASLDLGLRVLAEHRKWGLVG